MKKLNFNIPGMVFVLVFAVFIGLALAADTKITGLAEDTSPQTTDLVVTVDDPGGTPANKKATIGNVLGSYLVDIRGVSPVAGDILYFDGVNFIVLNDGSAGTYLSSDGDGTYTWSTPAGSGDVSKVGTPADGQVGVWTGDGTIEGQNEATFKAQVNLEIGTDVQAYNAYLADIAGLTPVANNLIGWNSGGTDLENKSQLTLQFATSAEFEGSTADDYETTLTVTDPTADRTVTFRDASGTVIISGDTFTGDVAGTLGTDGSTALTLGVDVVDEAHIADDGIDSEHYNDGSIDLEHLSAGAKFQSYAVASLGDTTTPSVLTTAETINKCISNYKASGADHVFTMPAAHAAGNIIFQIGDEFQVDIEPDTGDLFYLNGTAMATDEHIQNTADTLGERIVGYCVNINGTLRWMFYSSDSNWVEETP